MALVCFDLSSLDAGTCLDSFHIDPNLNYQNSRFALKAAHAMNCADGASQTVLAIAWSVFQYLITLNRVLPN